MRRWTWELLRPVEDIEATIVAIGSHDLTLDLLANRLHGLDPGLSLASSNVGSLGGLIALTRGRPIWRVPTSWTRRPASTTSPSSGVI